MVNLASGGKILTSTQLILLFYFLNDSVGFSIDRKETYLIHMAM